MPQLSRRQLFSGLALTAGAVALSYDVTPADDALGGLLGFVGRGHVV